MEGESVLTRTPVSISKARGEILNTGTKGCILKRCYVPRGDNVVMEELASFPGRKTVTKLVMDEAEFLKERVAAEMLYMIDPLQERFIYPFRFFTCPVAGREKLLEACMNFKGILGQWDGSHKNLRGMHMPYGGISLKDLDETIPAQYAIEMIKNLCGSILELQSHRLIHGDLHRYNVVVSDDLKKVRIIDTSSLHHRRENELLTEDNKGLQNCIQAILSKSEPWQGKNDVKAVCNSKNGMNIHNVLSALEIEMAHGSPISPSRNRRSPIGLPAFVMPDAVATPVRTPVRRLRTSDLSGSPPPKRSLF